MSNNPVVSLVVLNWNGLADTIACLRSLRQLDYKHTEIIVVDNGSTDGSKPYLSKQKGIKFVDLPSNTGFTGGQIAALQEAGGQYLALVNNDAVLAPDWVNRCLETFGRHSKVAAVGGRAYDWNTKEGTKAYNTTNPFYAYQVVNPVTAETLTVQNGELECSVNSISGAAVMISREAVDSVGYFDDRFFAYYEETDLFARMKRAGYSIFYNPAAHAWHRVAASTKDKPKFYLYHMFRNRFIFAFKNFDHPGRFVWHYKLQWLRCLAYVINPFNIRKPKVEQSAYVEAGAWNLLHLLPTLAARYKAKQLGKSYGASLSKDAFGGITVVIPCYNYAKYVAEAIKSAAHQTVPPTKIIVINDGSVDKSLSVIEKTVKNLCKKNLPTVFEVISQTNAGIIATKNRGLSLVTTEWLIFLDADDILAPNYIELCLSAQRQTNADVVYTDMKFFGADDGYHWVKPYNKYRLRAHNYIHNSSLYRSRLVKQAGGYDPDFHMGFEDWELNIKLSKLTGNFTHLPQPILRYRRHPGESRDNNANTAATLKTVIHLLRKKHPELYNFRYFAWQEVGHVLRASRGTASVLLRFPVRITKHAYRQLTNQPPSNFP